MNLWRNSLHFVTLTCKQAGGDFDLLQCHSQYANTSCNGWEKNWLFLWIFFTLTCESSASSVFLISNVYSSTYSGRLLIVAIGSVMVEGQFDEIDIYPGVFLNILPLPSDIELCPAFGRGEGFASSGVDNHRPWGVVLLTALTTMGLVLSLLHPFKPTPWKNSRVHGLRNE